MRTFAKLSGPDLIARASACIPSFIPGYLVYSVPLMLVVAGVVTLVPVIYMRTMKGYTFEEMWLATRTMAQAQAAAMTESEQIWWGSMP